MLVIKRRRGIFTEATVWFAEQRYTGADIVHYRSCRFPVTQMCIGAITLLTNLQQTDDEIIKMCESNCRNEIRRAMKNGDITFLWHGAEVTDDIIEEFVSFYNQFSQEKGWGQVDTQRFFQNLKAYRDSNGLIISSISVEGNRRVYHVYIVDGNRARLLHSCSLYRENESKEMRKRTGMANRYLHYDDLRKLRDIGYQWCDWGGAGKSPEVYNIYKFKKSFGGNHALVYNGTDYQNSVLRWLYWYYVYLTT